LPDIPRTTRPCQSWLPWVRRLAQRLVDGEVLALGEREPDEVLAILRAAIELVQDRGRRRPRPRRRAA
jgi:hypothetical protein